MPRHVSTGPYCVRCRLRLPVCVCAEAPRLATATRVLLVIHASEWSRTTNTGLLLRLGLASVDVRIHGSPRCSAGENGATASTFVLFPGCGAVPLTPELVAQSPGPRTLIVPDGNWNQTERMMRRLPMLQDARPVRLESERTIATPLRFNADPRRRSTFEAAAHALGLLEGPDVEARLLTFFRAVLEAKATANAPRDKGE